MFNRADGFLRSTFVILSAVLCSSFSLGLAQEQPAPPPPPEYPSAQATSFTPQQLDDLVAPVALYPDPLLGQVMAASTYPLEVAEAQQWYQQNSNVQGAQLVDLARQQNWDPSVQALVAFPDALRLLSSNIRWTTDLGNAFLSQQADVMAAVQRMRSRAAANGKLQSTPQQVVTDQTQNGQSAIEIQPAQQQVIYVPSYDPYYVWGPPVWGSYPDLYYPGLAGYGFGFGNGILVGSLFPGWGGWGGWGWGCGWFGSGLFVNAGFFHRYGYHGYYPGGGGGFRGRGIWAHDPVHRLTVPYPNRSVATRFHSNSFAGNRSFANSGRQFSGAGANGWNRFGGNSRGAANGYARTAPAQNFGGNRGAYNRPGYSAPSQGFRNSPYSSRSFSQGSVTPRYSAPRNFSAPRSFSAPAAPRSFGGTSGGNRGGFSSGGHSGFSGGGRGFAGGGFSGGGHGGFSGGGHAGGGGHHR